MNIEKLIKITSSQSINLAGSKIESLRCNNETRTTIRAYEGGFVGIAGQIGKVDENALINKAKDNLAQKIPYPCSLDSVGKRHENNQKTIIEKNDFVKVISSLINRLEKTYSNFCFDNKIQLKSTESFYTNSLDADYYFADNNFILSLVLRDKRLANIMDLAIGCTSKYYDEDMIVNDVGAYIEAYENKIDMPTNELPIILQDNIYQYFLKDIIAEYYMSGSSLLSNKLGSKVFNENLNIIANRSCNPNNIVPFFDDEGTINKNDRFDFVSGGILKGLIATKRSASLFNIASSGTSESAFDSVPSFGVGGIEVLPTHKTLSDITNSGIAIDITSGGDVTPDGNLSLPVQLAYLYENGQIKARLPEFMLSSNIFDILGKELLGVAKNDFEKFVDAQSIVTNMKIVKG